MTCRDDGANRLAHPLYQTGDGGSIPTSSLDLRFSVIDLKLAKPLNRLWHSRFPEYGGGGCRICFAAEHAGIWYAIAIWSNPSSPKLPQISWMMLKRFAIAPDRPDNTASRMMGWMIREIGRRFPEVQMLVSYSDPETHDGSIYRATGWQHDGETKRVGLMWHNRSREHSKNAPPRRVVRWLYPIWIGPMNKMGAGRQTHYRSAGPLV